MKILLLGAQGQLGWELQRSLACVATGDLVALHRHSTPYAADLSKLDELAHIVRTVAPDVIVNAAAYTAVDKAESDAEQAHVINALAPEVLAHEAQRLGAWLVHYSTDYVFDGLSQQRPWCETDAVAPLNVYGRTKLEGECLIQNSGARHLIFRTSWVYAARGGNFAKTMLKLATQREQLSVIHDQWGAPTGADLLADVTAHALRCVKSRPELAGLYHVSAAGEINWHGYAEFVLQRAREAGAQLMAQTVQAIPTSAYPTPAKRPLNSRLNTQQFQAAFDLVLPPWQQGVARMLDEVLHPSLAFPLKMGHHETT